MDAMLDCNHIMNEHVSIISMKCYIELPLRRLASIRIILTSTATATLVFAFVLSRIDYCNSPLFGSITDVTSGLKKLLNYLMLPIPKSANITSHFKSHHRPSVK